MTRFAVVFGASGGIGGALVAAPRARADFDRVLGYSRRSDPGFDLTEEDSIAARVAESAAQGEIRFAIDATGVLHDVEKTPEKSWREIDPAALQRAFSLNATARIGILL